jgi:YidC/Oxa1 family membrane protein insertase
VSALDPLNGVVAWVIMRLHTALGHLFGPNTGLAWFLSIALLVILIRICLIPLFVKQVHAQRKMAQHAPHLQELRKKYKGDKQRLNEETMKFYKENGVNPLAGCLPMIPQMIVFYALFSVLRAIADWKPGTPLKYGLNIATVESAQKATILGVHLSDSLLFSHQHVPVHVAIVIFLTVAVSATTTFMTVRQSSKRGLMNTNVDPDNPMAQSQKYMMYIVPFFSLTGLYWQYGLVLYWVTTNVWTLGQQYIMFRNWTVEPAGAAGATAAATTGTPVRTQSSLRAGSGTAKTAADGKRSGTAGAKSQSGSARAGSASSQKASTSSRSAATGNGSGGAGNRSAGNGSGGAANGSGGARTGADRRPATVTTTPVQPPVQASSQNSGEKRGLLRLGRQKPEPVPEPEVPTTRVVRQQPVRQAKSKRSGNKR